MREPSSPDAHRVTVLLPAYQGMPYVTEAVESVLRQSYRHFQLLVLDDGSTDGTAEALDGYRADPRFRLERLEHGGMAAALNHGLAVATTEYVARMDADDRCEPGRLSAQVAFLDAHPEVDVVGTAYRPLDADGRPGEGRPVLRTDADLRRLLHLVSPFVHGSVMFRREVVVAAGGYDGEYWPAEDYHLWCRLGGGFANLPEVLYLHRTHPSASSRPDQERQAARIAAELVARAPTPRKASLAEVLAGCMLHRHELRWYLRWQRRLRAVGTARQW